MNRKTIGILIILAGLIILGLIIYYLFFYNFNQAIVPEQKTATSTPTKIIATTTTPIKKIINIKTYTKEELSKDELVRLAAAFAERYGSYSNQSNYQNMADLKIFMSDNFQKITENSISQMVAKNLDHNIYYGITAKAVSENIQQFDNNAGTALVEVFTQRREALATTDNAATYPQSISISFVKENGVWKIDNAIWGGRRSKK